MEISEKYHSSNKRIAKNTLFLYLRQILMLVVSLYTSRVVLQTLGANDYGIFSLIGSFVAMFGVISGAFVVSITRYMSYVIGEHDRYNLTSLYSTSVWLMIIVGGFITIIVISSGIWYVQNMMVVSDKRIEATLYVLVFSALSFYINMLSVPYTSLIVAHEKMEAFAYITIVEALLKLFIACLLLYITFDKLIVYAFLIVTSSLIVRILYMWYCKSRFTECQFTWNIDKKLLKDMMKFVKWAFLGNGAIVLKEQGISIILNLFLGTTINAARGLSNSVNGAVNSFARNFIQATQPQITKLYSSGQYFEMQRLIFMSSRFSYFLIILLSVPIIKNIDYVLKIWLGNVPPYTDIFIILTLISSCVDSLSSPLRYGTLAEGNIKFYEIFLTVTYITSLPVSYAILYNGNSPTWIYVLMIFLDILVLLYLIWEGKRYGMQLKMFFKSVIVPVITVTIPVIIFVYILDLKMLISWPSICFFVESIIIGLVTIIIILTLGMNKQERISLICVLKNKFFKVLEGGK